MKFSFVWIIMFCHLSVFAQNNTTTTTTTETAPSPSQKGKMTGTWKIQDIEILEFEGYTIEEVMQEEGVETQEELWKIEEYQGLTETIAEVSEYIRFLIYKDGTFYVETHDDEDGVSGNWELTRNQELKLQFDDDEDEIYSLPILKRADKKMKLHLENEDLVINLTLAKLD